MFWKLISFFVNRRNLKKMYETYEYANKHMDIDKYVVDKIKTGIRDRLRKPVVIVVKGGTYRGQNLPFKIHNHRLLAIKMTIFFGIPFAIPFIIVRYHLLKASSGAKKSPKNTLLDPLEHTNANI